MNFVPYRGCKKEDISQGFNQTHFANDFWFPNCYGTWLVAPENVKIVKLENATILDGSTDGLNRGYGIRMRSIAHPEVEYLYWHCLPVFPVEVGDIVLGGEEVAQIGNSGICYSQGILVALGDKLNGKYPGSHLHYEEYKNLLFLDPSLDIDFNKQPKGDALKEILITLLKIFNLYKK